PASLGAGEHRYPSARLELLPVSLIHIVGPANQCRKLLRAGVGCPHGIAAGNVVRAGVGDVAVHQPPASSSSARNVSTLARLLRVIPRSFSRAISASFSVLSDSADGADGADVSTTSTPR